MSGLCVALIVNVSLGIRNSWGGITADPHNCPILLLYGCWGELRVVPYGLLCYVSVYPLTLNFAELEISAKMMMPHAKNVFKTDQHPLSQNSMQTSNNVLGGHHKLCVVTISYIKYGSPNQSPMDVNKRIVSRTIKAVVDQRRSLIALWELPPIQHAKMKKSTTLSNILVYS